MKRLVIGILAHVDSGKTTLSEAMLYHSGEIKQIGRVDHGDSFLDTDALERNRGITIFSKQAIMEVGDTSFTLLDTPGHVDFSAEMERSLQVMDYAILVVSGSEGIQSHTETLWKLLQRHNIPTFIFVNKMDLAIKKQSEIMADLKAKLGNSCVDFTKAGDDAAFMEEVAVCREETLEQFLETGIINQKDILASIHERAVFPCLFGCALKLEGTENFLEKLAEYTESPEHSKTFGAKVYKIGRDNSGNRLTYMKITGGTLMVRDLIKGRTKDGQPWEEKVNQIRAYSGLKFESLDIAEAGRIVAVTGLTETYTGEGLGIEKDEADAVLEPVLTYKVELPADVDSHTALARLKLLEEEDPTLRVVWNKEIDEIHLQLMGAIQMEVLASIIKERFNMEVSFGAGNIVYKETIKTKAYGVGHFEPLRHYAEVHLLLEPLEEGAGVIFDSDCSEDELDKNWQRLIMTHLDEKPHRGVLIGAPITDIKITLMAGKAHKKHTEGGDFRQATYRAVRQGLMQADSMLLEPWYNFTITLPTENVGRAMSDIQKMSGVVEPPETREDMSVLKGEAPVSVLSDYHMEINNYTKGRGAMACQMAGYKPCHNQDEVIAAAEYDPERDVVNTADSVFCQNGAGVNVKWDEVFDRMDVPSALEREQTDFDEDMRAKARAYAAQMVSDKDLMVIFERTYGPVKKDRRVDARVVKPKRVEEPVYRSNSPKLPSGHEYLLIDGYNVIYDWDELRDIMEADYGAARDKLIDILCNYQGFMQVNLILVFDAYKVKGNTGSVEKIGGINVVYTKEAETADMYIEKVTHEIARKHKVRVVTSDNLEQLIITGHGALKTSSAAFREEVSRVEEMIREYI